MGMVLTPCNSSHLKWFGNKCCYSVAENEKKQTKKKEKNIICFQCNNKVLEQDNKWSERERRASNTQREHTAWNDENDEISVELKA